MTPPEAQCGAVSVVVPLYNEGEMVFRLAAHLRRMSGLREAVLADASDQPASVDAIARLRASLRGQSRIRVLHCRARGRGAQMNAGAAECRGTILLFLHCDTRLPPRALESVARRIARGHHWGWFNVRINARAPRYRILECMINLRARITRIATGDHALFIRRRIFTRERGFAEIELMEDVELSRRLKKHGAPAALRMHARTSARRWRRHGFARTVWLMWKLRWRYFFGGHPARLASLYHDAR
ncbi:MAG: TIGR04283 family arsenosugar biosynthesis glycosyltransferase [Gammaproteobacteria bacterium]